MCGSSPRERGPVGVQSEATKAFCQRRRLRAREEVSARIPANPSRERRVYGLLIDTGLDIDVFNLPDLPKQVERPQPLVPPSADQDVGRGRVSRMSWALCRLLWTFVREWIAPETEEESSRESEGNI